MSRNPLTVAALASCLTILPPLHTFQEIDEITSSAMEGHFNTFALAPSSLVHPTAQNTGQTGPLSRRHFLGKVLLGWLAFSFPSATAQAGDSSALSVDKQAEIRAQLLARLEQSGRFKNEIEQLALPAEFGITRQTLHEAVGRLSEILNDPSWKIVSINGNEVLGIDPLKRQFQVNLELLPNVLAIGDLELFHEAIHLTASQLSAQQQAQKAVFVIESAVRKHASARLDPWTIFVERLWDTAIVGRDEELRNALTSILRLKWRSELEAFYLSIAAFEVRSKGEGVRSHAEAALHAMAPEDMDARKYVQAIEAGDRPDTDPGMMLQKFLVLGDSYEAGRVTPSFQTAIYLLEMADPISQEAVRLLGSAGGWDMSKVRDDQQQKKRFRQWLGESVLAFSKTLPALFIIGYWMMGSPESSPAVFSLDSMKPLRMAA